MSKNTTQFQTFKPTACNDNAWCLWCWDCAKGEAGATSSGIWTAVSISMLGKWNCFPGTNSAALADSVACRMFGLGHMLVEAAVLCDEAGIICGAVGWCVVWNIINFIDKLNHTIHNSLANISSGRLKLCQQCSRRLCLITDIETTAFCLKHSNTYSRYNNPTKCFCVIMAFRAKVRNAQINSRSCIRRN